MVFCGAAIVIPIILCFLSMIMLFMAEGKKTMFLPTVFTFATSAEMAVSYTHLDVYKRQFLQHAAVLLQNRILLENQMK